MPILRAEVGGFVLPFANPRHAHEYAVLKRLPARCRPDHGGGRDRHADQLRRAPEDDCRTDRARRRAVGDRRRVLAGTDCGFDTSAGQRRVAEDVVWAKLAALGEGARIASDRLF